MVGTESASDDVIEKFSESLRTIEDHQLTGELSRLYHYMRSVEGRDEPEDLEVVKKKIGSLEEEMGRRKKEGVWIW